MGCNVSAHMGVFVSIPVYVWWVGKRVMGRRRGGIEGGEGVIPKRFGGLKAKRTSTRTNVQHEQNFLQREEGLLVWLVNW